MYIPINPTFPISIGVFWSAHYRDLLTWWMSFSHYHVYISMCIWRKTKLWITKSDTQHETIHVTPGFALWLRVYRIPHCMTILMNDCWALMVWEAWTRLEARPMQYESNSKQNSPSLFSCFYPFCQSFTSKCCFDYQFHTPPYQWKSLSTYLHVFW